MKFGVNVRKKRTGGEVYVLIFQISSILPVLFVLLASGYNPVITNNGLFAFLFRLGLSALPTWEGLVLSAVYRKTASEVIVVFVLLAAALAFGLLANRLLKGSEKTARRSRMAFLALIGLDLALRLLPLGFNQAFGLPAAIVAFLIRLCCLVLLLLDLIADRRERSRAEG